MLLTQRDFRLLKVAGAAARACLLRTELSELPAGRLLVYQGVTVGCAATDGTFAVMRDIGYNP